MPEAVSSDDGFISIYRSIFAPLGGGVTGDITPGYATLDDALVREIARSFPSVRILLVLREPISRLWSQARLMEAATGSPNTSNLEAFRHFCRLEGVVARSFQSRVYERWYAAFGERIHLLFFDDLCNSPEVYFRDVCRILGIGEDPSLTRFPMGFNRKAKPPLPMPSEFRRFAASYFEGEHEKLAALCGGPTINWLRSLEE